MVDAGRGQGPDAGRHLVDGAEQVGALQVGVGALDVHHRAVGRELLGDHRVAVGGVDDVQPLGVRHREGAHVPPSPQVAPHRRDVVGDDGGTGAAGPADPAVVAADAGQHGRRHVGSVDVVDHVHLRASADPDRDGLGGPGVQGGAVVDAVVVAPEAHVVGAEQQADQLQGLVGAPAPLAPRHPHRRELHVVVAGADAQDHPAAAREAVEAGDLLGDDGGMAERRAEDGGSQADALGGSGGHRQSDHRVLPGDGVHVGRHQQVVDHPEAREAGLLHPGEVRHQGPRRGRGGEGPRVGGDAPAEVHQVPAPAGPPTGITPRRPRPASRRRSSRTGGASPAGTPERGSCRAAARARSAARRPRTSTRCRGCPARR